MKYLVERHFTLHQLGKDQVQNIVIEELLDFLMVGKELSVINHVAIIYTKVDHIEQSAVEYIEQLEGNFAEKQFV